MHAEISARIGLVAKKRFNFFQIQNCPALEEPSTLVWLSTDLRLWQTRNRRRSRGRTGKTFWPNSEIRTETGTVRTGKLNRNRWLFRRRWRARKSPASRVIRAAWPVRRTIFSAVMFRSATNFNEKCSRDLLLNYAMSGPVAELTSY